MIVQILMSVLLGMLPEVLYFTLFLKYTKNLQEKTVKLGLLIGIAYILCMFIQRYQVVYYIIFIALIYVILKLLYKDKAQIIDVFVIATSYFYLTIISFIISKILYNDLSNYNLLLIISRLLLILPFIFRNKFNIIYQKYYKLWNRNDNEIRPLKSITIRNISLILLNILIFVINIVCLYIINI